MPANAAYYEDEPGPHGPEYERYGPGPENDPAANGEPRQLWRVSHATVYYGAFTVNSREHKVKVDGGWMEYVYGYKMSSAVPITEAEARAEDAYILNPYTYKLTFFKDEKY